MNTSPLNFKVRPSEWMNLLDEGVKKKTYIIMDKNNNNDRAFRFGNKAGNGERKLSMSEITLMSLRVMKNLERDSLALNKDRKEISENLESIENVRKRTIEILNKRDNKFKSIGKTIAVAIGTVFSCGYAYYLDHLLAKELKEDYLNQSEALNRQITESTINIKKPPRGKFTKNIPGVTDTQIQNEDLPKLDKVEWHNNLVQVCASLNKNKNDKQYIIVDEQGNYRAASKSDLKKGEKLMSVSEIYNNSINAMKQYEKRIIFEIEHKKDTTNSIKKMEVIKYATQLIIETEAKENLTSTARDVLVPFLSFIPGSHVLSADDDLRRGKAGNSSFKIGNLEIQWKEAVENFKNKIKEIENKGKEKETGPSSSTSSDDENIEENQSTSDDNTAWHEASDEIQNSLDQIEALEQEQKTHIRIEDESLLPWKGRDVRKTGIFDPIDVSNVEEHDADNNSILGQENSTVAENEVKKTASTMTMDIEALINETRNGFREIKGNVNSIENEISKRHDLSSNVASQKRLLQTEEEKQEETASRKLIEQMDEIVEEMELIEEQSFSLPSDTSVKEKYEPSLTRPEIQKKEKFSVENKNGDILANIEISQKNRIQKREKAIQRQQEGILALEKRLPMLKKIIAKEQENIDLRQVYINQIQKEINRENIKDKKEVLGVLKARLEADLKLVQKQKEQAEITRTNVMQKIIIFKDPAIKTSWAKGSINKGVARNKKPPVVQTKISSNSSDKEKGFLKDIKNFEKKLISINKLIDLKDHISPTVLPGLEEEKKQIETVLKNLREGS